jgi:hypothetical protein
MLIKNIFLLIIFFTVTTLLFGEDLEYITIKKTMLYDNDTVDFNKSRDALFEIDKDIKVKHSVRPHMFKKTKEKIIIGTFIYNKTKYYIDCADLIPANTVDTFDPLFISDLNSNIRETWVPAYYIKVLQSLNRDTILALDKHWREFDPYWLGQPGDADFSEEWYERFIMLFPYNEFNVSNSVLVLNNSCGMMIKNIKKTDNGYVVTVKFSQSDWEKFKHDDLNWDSVKEKEFFDMILCIDGDYMDVYLDDTEHKLTTFALVDQIFLKELKSLVENEKADLSKITSLPRRADGSMDDYPLPLSASTDNVFWVEDKMPESAIGSKNQTKAVVQNDIEKSTMPLWAWIAIIGGVVVVSAGTALFVVKRRK